MQRRIKLGLNWSVFGFLLLFSAQCATNNKKIQQVINSLKQKRMAEVLLEVSEDGLRMRDASTKYVCFSLFFKPFFQFCFREEIEFFKLSKLRNWKALSDGTFCFCATVHKQPKNFVFRTEHVCRTAIHALEHSHQIQ